jgi:hypothetical protein
LDRKEEDKKAMAMPERDWANEEISKIVGTNLRTYCKQTISCSETHKTNPNLSGNKPKSDPKSGTKSHLLLKAKQASGATEAAKGARRILLTNSNSCFKRVF